LTAAGFWKAFNKCCDMRLENVKVVDLRPKSSKGKKKSKPDHKDIDVSKVSLHKELVIVVFEICLSLLSTVRTHSLPSKDLPLNWQ
jgi:hypothetical protein